MHVNVDLQCHGFKSFPIAWQEEEASKRKKKKENNKYIMGCMESLLPFSFIWNEEWAQNHEQDQCSVMLWEHTKDRSKVCFLTGKIYVYNKIFSLRYSIKM